MAEKSAIPVELGTEKIGRLLKQYALPAIIAQTASSLYNMVDSIFIGQGVGPLAISGLAENITGEKFEKANVDSIAERIEKNVTEYLK